MGYLIGTDEAGYAPNLGPLVISATVWEAPDGVGGEDLFERLAHVITDRPIAARNRRVPATLLIADSKVLYSSEKGLRHLERGLWGAMGLLDYRPTSWRDVWRTVAPDALDQMRLVPWYADYDGSAPLDCDGEDLTLLDQPLRAGLSAAGVRLVAVRSRAIFAHQFNELVEQYGSKGAALSHQTLGLAAELIESLPTANGMGTETVGRRSGSISCDSAPQSPSSPFVSVICDKHGGRNRYADLLAEHFPESFIEIRGEGGRRSSYRFGLADRRVEFCFRVQAESCLPAALASMASKYLRELAMRAFNDFWRRQLPDIEPTAGYPVDAKRFRANIAEKQRQLQIADRILWRER